MRTPIFNWLDQRGAGLLLHPTSLPGNYGIGTLGESARKALDFMYETGLQYWQVCPLGPTGFGDSPYQSFSTFALNPYLIDLDALKDQKLIAQADLSQISRLPKSLVNYGKLYKTKWPVLKTAYKNFIKSGADEVANYGSFSAFKEKNKSWLHPYALFMAIKDSLNGASWNVWDFSISSYELATQSNIAKDLANDVDAYSFYQYLIYAQWEETRAYAAERGISIIGDIPIFVAYDSADTWANPEVFLLDQHGNPEVVAGVPPDYFSEDGQLWGNPLFNWDYLKETKYDWWLKRCAASFAIYDVVRIDHFRGFCDYWEIPAGEKTAKNGTWKKGPGLDFFQAIKTEFPDSKIIAEDLGIITEEVRKLRSDAGLPGMGILHFAFDGSTDNAYLPENLDENCVVYPGTHDNDTTKGWLNSLKGRERNFVKKHLGSDGSNLTWDIICAAMESRCHLSVVALQDFLELDTKARLNSPGTAAGNWQWRYSEEALDNLLHQKGQEIYSLIESTERYNP